MSYSNTEDESYDNKLGKAPLNKLVFKTEQRRESLVFLGNGNTAGLIRKLVFKPVIFLSPVILKACSIVWGLHRSFLHFFIKTLEKNISPIVSSF